MGYHIHMNNTQKNTIAIVGATGGLGQEICKKLVTENNLILVGRSQKKMQELKDTLLQISPAAKIDFISADLNDIDSVKNACKNLKKLKFSTLILNAGIYNVPRSISSCGYDNVFQVNFVSQYYMVKELLPYLEEQDNSHIVAVGSIAYNYTQLDENDVDFRARKKCNLVYGNSKRFLMFSLYNLFENNYKTKLSIVHPGVTLTNITNHYPKWINWFVKIGIKLVFPSPKNACKSIVEGVKNECNYWEWIGPKFCNIWGKPKKKRLKKIKDNEDQKMFKIAEEICAKISD